MTTPASCATLLDTSPLPEGWSPLEVVEDCIAADGLELHRSGLASVGPDGVEVTGSGADAVEAPVRRSYFELLERVTTLEAHRHKLPVYELRTIDFASRGEAPADLLFPESDDPKRWRFAKSNGVALHADWTRACLRARWELAERDRVLRAWYGDIQPVPLPVPAASPLHAARSYEWHACDFPEPAEASFSRGVEVVGVFGFPTRREAPLALGFAARDNRQTALEAATTEAMQLLAFLWGEPLPEALPAVGPTPVHHLDRFQWRGHHPTLRRWLDAGHARYADPSTRARTNLSAEVLFVDLTPSWLGGGLRVAKAICLAAAPLAFGDAPFARHLPMELQAHPIA